MSVHQWVGDEPPFLAGVVHGVRTWGFREGVLVPPMSPSGGTWKPGGEPTVARCSRKTGHHAPRPGCGCGLYALHPWSSPWPGTWGAAFGVVEAWGRVELHADGFRAQYARPIALFAFLGAGSGLVELARRYECELIEWSEPREPAQVCADRGWGIAQSTVRDLVPPDQRSLDRLALMQTRQLFRPNSGGGDPRP